MPPKPTQDPVAAQVQSLRETVEALAREVKSLRQAEQLSALFVADAPAPVRAFYGIYGSRATFCRWRKQGLATFHIEGMGTSVIPSELVTYLISKRGNAAPAPEADRAPAQ